MTIEPTYGWPEEMAERLMLIAKQYAERFDNAAEWATFYEWVISKAQDTIDERAYNDPTFSR